MIVRRLKRLVATLLVGGLLVLAALALWAWSRGHPQDLPWTPLDLTQPPGAFTASKLGALAEDGEACRAQLTRAGVRFTALPPRRGDQCGYRDAVRLRPGGPFTTRFRPEGLGTSCPVAAGLALWSWHTLGPASRAILGSPVVAVEHYGSYSCRRIYGRDRGAWSEHATANAVDIAGFVLADGRRIRVAADWKDGDGERSRFLHAARDGACLLFGTVLSPDYNAAHADHLHLDQARRSVRGVCR